MAPNSVEALVNLGEFYRAVGRFADAEPVLKPTCCDRRAVSAQSTARSARFTCNGTARRMPSPTSRPWSRRRRANARFELSDYYLRIGRYAEAVRTLDDLAKEPANYSAARTRVALIEFAAGHHGRADEIINEILTREPRNAGALTTRARLLLVQARLDDARAAIKNALSLAPSSSDAQLTLARIELANNNTEEARKALNETLRLDPRSLAALLELSQLHRNLQQVDTAVQLAETAIRLYPTSAPARLTLIRALLVRPDDRPRAEKELAALEAANPSPPECWASLARCCLIRTTSLERSAHFSANSKSTPHRSKRCPDWWQST